MPGYGEDTTCGNVYVHGNYTSALTIAAQNDVIINGNLSLAGQRLREPTSNAMLGLVANNFVRIFHPVVKTYSNRLQQKERAAAMTNTQARDLRIHRQVW